ncbi:MAG TPA: hydantoinase B/oxoprolinase family protein [Candidatus Dormibacteraeota bacterium]|jgi:N-methylhydantoinase B
MDDPIAFEVVKNGLAALADELAITIVRTAHSQVVRDSLDFSTAICDAEGRVVAQGCGIPLHLGAIPDAMQVLGAKFAGDVNPDDVFILNDPDEGGMHLPDIFIIKPVFAEHALIGYAACVAHYPEIGGRMAGGNAVDSTEIFQEGLQIPLLKLYDRGRRDETLIAILLRNVRIPDVVMGDLDAQLAACHVGEAGLLALASRYGAPELQDFMAQVLDYTESRLRAELQRMPDGEYSFADHIDDDGFGSGPIRIAVTLRIAGDQLVADFSGTSPQVRSALNATMSFTKATVYAALKCVVDDDIPSNSGFYRPITVNAPAGTILNPLRPAPRAARGLTGFRAFDVVLRAFADALPGRVPAAGEGGASMIAIGGRRADHSPFIFVDFVTGGWGARPAADGLDGNSPIAANLSNVPVEEIEAHDPIRVERYGFLPDTGGAGRFRGCLSVIRQYRFLEEEALLQLRSDRRDHLPYGLEDGWSGTPSSNVLNPGLSDERSLPTNVTTEIRNRDVFRHITAGGGGYGQPLQRECARVLDDVLDGKISTEYAERVYGVVMVESGDRVDDAATRSLRDRLTAPR